MFSSNLRIVPWRNREEWLRVYEDAYSNDFFRQAKACQTMEMWLLLRNDVPPGVECTLNILSALQQELEHSPRQLQLIFSTAVIRVVNMLCDNARQSGKETIYSIAKYYNLPDWIVNLRHDVSHGSSLPDLSALNRAAKFLLSWLREYYWEIEKEEMKDIVLKRSRYDACKDNVEFYLNLFIEIMQILLEQGNIKIKKIKNNDLSFKLFDVNRRRGFMCAIECLPWILHAKDNFAKEIPCDGIPNMKITEFIPLMLLQLQDYITKASFWQVDMLPLVIKAMCNHCTNNNKIIAREIWEPVIEKLNEWEVLDRALKILCQLYQSQDEASMKWFSEFYRAVVKRHLADKLRADLSKSVILSNNVEEQDLACKTMLRKRLALALNCNEKAVQIKLFTRVEKKNADLKVATRLSTPVQYIIDSCTAFDMIKTLVIHPTKETLVHLNYLFQIVDPEFPENKKEELFKLLLIQLGSKTSNKHPPSNNFNIKTVSDVKKAEIEDIQTQVQLGFENKVVEMETLDHESQNHMDHMRSHFVRSGWNFNNCTLGTTPWDLQGTEYYHKAFDHQNPVQCFLFPITVQRPFNVT